MAHDPETDTEWQEAVDAAHVWLLVDSARQYGLVSGGPVVDIHQCMEVLRLGQERGIRPSPNAVERFFHQAEDEVSRG